MFSPCIILYKEVIINLPHALITTAGAPLSRSLNMLARTFVFLAILGSAAGQAWVGSTATPKGGWLAFPKAGVGKGAGKGAGRGAPAPVNLPELHTLRDEMRRAWCAGGRNAAMAPCQMEAFMNQLKAEKDPVKKKAMASSHVAQHAEKRNSRVKVPPWQRPSSAPAPPQGAPGGSGRLETPRTTGRATGRPTTA